MQLAEFHPPYFERPHLRQDNLAVPIHLQYVLSVNATPHGHR